MDEYIFIYATYPSTQIAREISEGLVEKRLVSCANIIPAIEAIYQWQNKVEKAQEVAVFYKSTSVLFSSIEAYIKEKHPYECPCIVAQEIQYGSSDYLKWISTETVVKSDA